MFSFLVFDWKYPLLGKFGSKAQNCQLMLELGTQTNSIMQNKMVIFISSFSSGNTLFVQIWSKNQNFQFKLKFGTQTNSNDGEFNGGVQFFCFRLEIPILGKFGFKIRNCLFKVKFGAQTNSGMQNSMVMFTFSFFDQRYFFWANLA